MIDEHKDDMMLQTDTHMRKCVREHTHTCAHTRMQAYTHIHTHTHTQLTTIKFHMFAA